RGLNVGKAKRIAMAELRPLFEDLGYRDFRTLLNSGNGVFASRRTDTAVDARRLAEGLGGRTDLTADTLVIDADTLDRIVAGHPFPTSRTTRPGYLWGCCSSPATRRRSKPCSGISRRNTSGSARTSAISGAPTASSPAGSGTGWQARDSGIASPRGTGRRS